MTVEEIIEELLEIVNEEESLSVKDLVDIVESLSVEDRIASDNALTIFYTGESEKLINRLVETALVFRHNLVTGGTQRTSKFPSEAYAWNQSDGTNKLPAMGKNRKGEKRWLILMNLYRKDKREPLI